MRLGVFGGTFDPPHTGHFLVAGDAFEALELDELLWIPAARQPLKGAPGASPEQRSEMVRLAIEGDSRFAVETMELERGGLSFTVDTLAELRSRHADATVFLLLGADAWAQFAGWREPARIREMAEIVLLARSGTTDSSAGGEAGNAPRTITVRRVDVSSTEIRDRVQGGLPIEGFVRDSVARYIAAAGIYREGIQK